MYNFKSSNENMKRAERIGIFTHSNADGDAIGSAFALYFYLKGLGKDVEVVCDTTLPNQLKFLKVEELIHNQAKGNYDLVIATDCNTPELMGINKAGFLACKNSIQFDHHPKNPQFAKVNNVNTETSSASEVVAKFFIENGIKITKQIGEFLLSGIITDSGGFKFSCATTNTMLVVSKILSESGAELSYIMNSLFESETMDSFKMQKYAINHTEFLFGGQAVIIKIDNSFFKETGIDPNACKFLTRIGTELKDVKLTALISEVTPNVNKVSFRSRAGYSANACASVFGGGGHNQASGCKIYGNFYEAVERVIKAMGDELGCRE